VRPSFILTDIDHTLLSERGELPRRNAEALRRACDEGSTVVLATARSFPGALPVHEALGLSTPLIVSNGTLVYESDGSLIHTVTIRREVVEEIFELFKDSGLHWSLRAGDVAYLHEDFDRSRAPYSDDRYYAARLPEALEGVVSLSLFGEGVAEFFETHDWAKWALAGAYYAPSAFDRREAMTLISEQTSKGEAAAWLREHLGLAHLPILAIGDSLADATMFALGTGVAPANSIAEVQEAAHWVAPHCDEGAVAAAVERFVLVGENPAGEGG
jgi:Cof subfamily protein (haloacid dehalogenase superfamily)